MASNTIDLKWEWPAGRAIGARVLAQVESVQPASRGLFGMRASPSMADALPDATDVTVVVDSAAALHAGRRLQLKLPGIEARKLKAGDWAALGLIENGTVCVCVAGSPARSADEARAWLPGAPCG